MLRYAEPVRRLGADELVDRLVYSGDDLADDPLVVVDCTDTPAGVDDHDVRARLAGFPAVIVAMGASAGDRLGDALDLRIDEQDTLDRVVTTIEDHHQAAIALAVLLRGGDERSVNEGLVAESATYAVLQSGADHHHWLRACRERDNGPAPEDGDAVRVERRGDRLHLTLDRPAVRNAFNTRMRDELLDALAIAAADPNVEVIVDANGPSFCSGGDLREFGTTPDPATAHLVRLRRSVGRSLHALADRVTVRVHGACVGAGVELPAFAGHVVARPDTTFRLPELAMGLVPGAGGTVSLSHRIGRQRTARLAILGTPIDAATALTWGLVDEIAP